MIISKALILIHNIWLGWHLNEIVRIMYNQVYITMHFIYVCKMRLLGFQDGKDVL